MPNAFEPDDNLQPDCFEFLPDKPGCSTVKLSRKAVLNELKLPRVKSGTAESIASSRFYVHQDETIDDIVDALNEDGTLLAIGVVDSEKRAVGVIVRRELFNLFGKQYGKDFMERRTAAKVMKDVERFGGETHVYSISDSIGKDIRSQEIRYYLITGTNGEFRGVFSTRDLLIVLAEITQKDIDLARLLQNSIVKQSDRQSHPAFELTACSQMAKGVGGDFYGWREYQPNRYLISIADVSGKGVAASLLTAVLGGILHAFDFSRGISEFVRQTNDYIINTFQMEKYLTGIFIDFNSNTGEISLCDMGHSHLHLYRNGKVFRVKTSDKNPPIGITPEVEAAVDHFRLKAGDWLILSTDGVTEQTDETGEEFGMERTAVLIAKHAPEGPESVKTELLAGIANFKGGNPQRDDITFLILAIR